MKIVPISLPTPFYIGPVNVYLIAEDPITIIDTGPKTEEAVTTLRDGLKRAGFTVADIRRIVLTHAHEDHCGLARALRDEAKDAQVFVHGWETGHRAGRLEHDENLRLLTQAGVPHEGKRLPVWNADALTINPYLGRDAVEPFLHTFEASNKHVIFGFEPIETLVDGVEVSVDLIESCVHPLFEPVYGPGGDAKGLNHWRGA